MSEEKGKVVDFNKRKEQLNQMTPEEFIQTQFSPEVLEELKKIEKLTVDLTEKVQKELINFSDSYNGQVDISVPLEALIVSASCTAMDFDFQVLPESLPEHRQLRVDLMNDVTQFIVNRLEKEENVYSQDIYIALFGTLISFIKQHRLYSVYRQLEGKEE